MIRMTGMSLLSKVTTNLYFLTRSIIGKEDMLNNPQANSNEFSHEVFHSIEKQQNIIEVYLYYPNRITFEKPKNVAYFFESSLYKLNDEQISRYPIFLNQRHALQYSQFMSENHVILKGYVAQDAIQGYQQALSIKPGYLYKETIHGCFPSWTKSRIYYINPNFELEHLLRNVHDPYNGCLTYFAHVP